MKTNIAPIYFRELKALFFSPIAYLVLVMFWLVSGYFWGSVVMAYSNYSMEMMSRQSMGGQLKIMDYMISPFLGNMMVTFLFVLPMVSMRAFSEEKKSGTIELLFTYPFSDLDILLGKYLASLTFLALLVGGTMIFPLTVADQAKLQWPVVFLGFAGLTLVGAAFLALGTFTSTFTENQVVAAALGFGSLLLLFVLGWVSQSGAGSFSGLFNELSVMNHFQNFSKGLLSLKDVSYFVLFIGFFLFATLRVLESKTWR